jgi:hypothetical protein
VSLPWCPDSGCELPYEHGHNPDPPHRPFLKDCLRGTFTDPWLYVLAFAAVAAMRLHGN